jgi:hypothetical protein
LDGDHDKSISFATFGRTFATTTIANTRRSIGY